MTYACAKHGPYDKIEVSGRSIKTYCLDCLEDRERVRERIQIEVSAKERVYCLARDSGIPHRYVSSTVANWVPRNKVQQGVKAVLGDWIRDCRRQVKRGAGILFLGGPGLGKTHLLAACATEVICQGTPARYEVWSDVIARHKATFGRRDREGVDLLSALATVPVLALDELGLRAGSEFDQGLLFGLIDSRYRNGLTTLAASNATPDTLNMIGERTADRLRDCCMQVTITGESYRGTVDQAREVAQAVIQRPQPRDVNFTMSIDGEMTDHPFHVEP